MQCPGKNLQEGGQIWEETKTGKTVPRTGLQFEMGFMAEKALETHIVFAQKTLDHVLRESFVSLGRS
jgi:hypothetical protein